MEPAGEYDQEAAKAFANPSLYAIAHYLETIEDAETPVATKKECLDELEMLLVNQDISTTPAVLPQLRRCLLLLRVPGVEAEVCTFLGYISQNVAPVAQELVTGGVFSECAELYRCQPECLNKILFLLNILVNTLPNLAGLLPAGGSESAILEIALDAPELDDRARERLAAIKKAVRPARG